MMTTLTSVIGMAPLVLMPGAGSELYRGLGSVVLAGLLCAAIFTLGVVPMLLTLVLDAKQVVFGAADGPAKAARTKWEQTVKRNSAPTQRSSGTNGMDSATKPAGRREETPASI
jgi:predicted RND superfamily exporter protein